MKASRRLLGAAAACLVAAAAVSTAAAAPTAAPAAASVDVRAPFCAAPSLRARVLPRTVALGTLIVPVAFTNVSSFRCIVAGYPRLAVGRRTLRTSRGTLLGDRGPARALGRWQSAVFVVTAPARCAAEDSGRAVAVAVALPAVGQKIVRLPAGFVRCPLAISRFGAPSL